MEYLIGIILAFSVSLFAAAVGLDRSRAFYPVIAIIVTTYYALFAIMGGSLQALALECIVIPGFILLAVLGFKLDLWFAVAALAGHGIFDLFHGHFISNPGLPVWWPGFCMAYDVTAAGYLAWLLIKRSKRAMQP
jgi:hypothetical protein